MELGFAQMDISPDQPCNLGGYAAVREMEGIHDPLYVKVTLMRLDEEVYGLACYDLIAVDHLLMDAVKKLWEEANIPIKSFHFHATHTHSGPMGVLDTSHGFAKGTIELMGERQESLIQSYAEKTFQAIQTAYGSLAQGALRIQSGTCVGIGANRTSRTLQGNPHFFLMEACTSTQRALFTNFACHPTILGADNLHCSADFPGAYAKQIESIGYDFSFYINGSCGDISTRFTREGSGFLEVARMGKLLADAVKDRLSTLQPFSIKERKIKHISIPLVAKQPKEMNLIKQEIEDCKKRLEKARQAMTEGKQLRLIESALEGAQADLRYAMSYDGTQKYHVNVTMWKWNDEIFICIPGELFSELSNPYQDGHTHFLGYTDGYLMYFADQSAYEHQLYEAMSSPFAKGESETMMKIIHKQINDWRKEYE